MSAINGKRWKKNEGSRKNGRPYHRYNQRLSASKTDDSFPIKF